MYEEKDVLDTHRDGFEEVSGDSGDDLDSRDGSREAVPVHEAREEVSGGDAEGSESGSVFWSVVGGVFMVVALLGSAYLVFGDSPKPVKHTRTATVTVQAGCTFDNYPTLGDYVVPSPKTPGRCYAVNGVYVAYHPQESLGRIYESQVCEVTNPLTGDHYYKAVFELQEAETVVEEN
jgi:hypothetical protein